MRNHDKLIIHFTFEKKKHFSNITFCYLLYLFIFILNNQSNKKKKKMYDMHNRER